MKPVGAEVWRTEGVNHVERISETILPGFTGIEKHEFAMATWLL